MSEVLHASQGEPDYNVERLRSFIKGRFSELMPYEPNDDGSDEAVIFETILAYFLLDAKTPQDRFERERDVEIAIEIMQQGPKLSQRGREMAASRALFRDMRLRLLGGKSMGVRQIEAQIASPEVQCEVSARAVESKKTLNSVSAKAAVHISRVQELATQESDGTNDGILPPVFERSVNVDLAKESEAQARQDIQAFVVHLSRKTDDCPVPSLSGECAMGVLLAFDIVSLPQVREKTVNSLRELGIRTIKTKLFNTQDSPLYIVLNQIVGSTSDNEKPCTVNQLVGRFVDARQRRHQTARIYRTDQEILVRAQIYQDILLGLQTLFAE